MKTEKIMAAVAAALVLLAGVANAVLTDPVSLDYLAETEGATIEIGDKVFSDFRYTATGLTSFDAAEIDVYAEIADDGTYYLTWAGDISLATLDPIATADLVLNYTVTASQGSIWMIDQYYTGDVGAGIGALSIKETVSDGQSTVAWSNLTLSDLSDPFAEAGDNLYLDPSKSVLYVTKDIALAVASPSDGLGFISVSEVRQSFHQTVPDGSLTVSLLGLGLAGLALARRMIRS